MFVDSFVDMFWNFSNTQYFYHLSIVLIITLYILSALKMVL